MSITFYVSREEMEAALEALGLQITPDVDSITIYTSRKEEHSC